MDKKLQEAYRMVFNDLKEYSIFNGKFDAKHGNKNYMYGVCTIGEMIAYNAGDDCYEEYEKLFHTNFEKSYKEAEENA